jgi:ribose transport system ATP-binding protein
VRIGSFGADVNWRLKWRSERKSVCRTFERFGLAINPDRRIDELSQADRALVAIVRAFEEIRTLSQRGQGILVLDEPTPFLPKAGIDDLFALVRQIAAEGASVIFVSHDIDEITNFTDRATVLRDGVVAGTLTSKMASAADFVELIVGEKFAAFQAAPKLANDKPSVARIRDLRGETVDKFECSLHQGEIVGLTGLIGSGFDEVPYLLFGAKPARSGTLTLAGANFDLSAMRPATCLRAGIAFLSADRLGEAGIGSLSIADNMSLPALDAYVRWLIISWSLLYTRTQKLGRRYDVRPNLPRRRIDSLSGGNQQKVLLAKWLQIKPRILILHEPTQGVDIGARQNIYGALSTATKDGTAILCASTDCEQLAQICDRVLIFAGGYVVEELKGADLTKDRIAKAALHARGDIPLAAHSQGRQLPTEPDKLERGGTWADPRKAIDWLHLAESSALVVALIVLRAIFGVLAPDTFLSWGNITTMLGSQSVLVILTLALIIPLTAGDLDLSIASVLNLSAMMVGVLNVYHHLPIWGAVALALAAGAVIGAVNAGFIIYFRIPSLIVTLGTGTFLSGVTLWISGSNTIGGIDDTLVEYVVVRRIFGIPLAFYYALALCTALWYFLNYATLGRRLLFVGRGRDVAHLSGINVELMRFSSLVAASILSAAAGVVYAGTIGSADPLSGLSFLLPAFAAQAALHSERMVEHHTGQRPSITCR